MPWRSCPRVYGNFWPQPYWNGTEWIEQNEMQLEHQNSLKYCPWTAAYLVILYIKCKHLFSPIAIVCKFILWQCRREWWGSHAAVPTSSRQSTEPVCVCACERERERGGCIKWKDELIRSCPILLYIKTKSKRFQQTLTDFSTYHSGPKLSVWVSAIFPRKTKDRTIKWLKFITINRWLVCASLDKCVTKVQKPANKFFAFNV